MAKKKPTIVEKVKTLHIQSHSYPSRGEIITKCEAGSLHPMLKTKGMGRSYAENAREARVYRENHARIFGERPLNNAKEPIV